MELNLNSELLFVTALQQTLQQLFAAHEPDPVKKPSYYFEMESASSTLVENCALVLSLDVFYHDYDPEENEMRKVELHFSPPEAAQDVELQLCLLQGEECNEVFSQFLQFANSTEYATLEGQADVGVVGARTAKLIFEYVVNGVVPETVGLQERLQGAAELPLQAAA